MSVKHLNPRQGITTYFQRVITADIDISVKHLNPRQGITTLYCVVKAKTAAQKV